MSRLIGRAAIAQVLGLLWSREVDLAEVEALEVRRRWPLPASRRPGGELEADGRALVRWAVRELVLLVQRRAVSELVGAGLTADAIRFALFVAAAREEGGLDAAAELADLVARGASRSELGAFMAAIGRVGELAAEAEADESSSDGPRRRPRS